MKLGMSSAAFYGQMETEDQAALLNQFPVEVCEIFLETHSEYTAPFGALVRERLAGLPCLSVHPKGTQFEQDLFGRSRRQEQDALKTFRGVCEAGQAMGARYYVFHGPFAVSGRLRPGAIFEVEGRMANLRAIAADHGLELLWENVSWCAMRDPEDVRQVMELLPDMGFVLDVKQALRAGVEPLRMLEAMGGRVRHVHVLDWDAEDRLRLPGQGTIDWRALIGALRAQGYDGAVVLEPYEWMTRDHDAVRRSLECLREAMM